MKEEIIDILKKNLPELEVESITAMHQEVLRLRKDNKSITTDRDYFEKLHTEECDTTASLKQDLAKHDSMDVRMEAATKRETELLKRELSLENSLLKMEADNAHSQVDLAKYFYEIPFKNRQVRESVHDMVKVRHDTVASTVEYGSSGISETKYAPVAEVHEHLEPTTKTTETEET